jgi:hypothetical protein
MKTLLLTALLTLGLTAKAGSTGTIIISGTVLPVNDIVITTLADASNLNITAGEVGKLVATVSETSNNLTGYRIKMKSLNGGKLNHTVDSSKNTTYTVSYNGGSYMALSTSDQDVKNVGSLNGLTTQVSQVKVDVTAYPIAPAGTYTDTITVTIQAN